MKLYLRNGFITIILLLFFTSAFPQFNSSYNFKFKTYTSKDGLVHNYTKKCRTDNKGFLWIITQHGLSRFDGINFKNFEHVFNTPGSLPENDLEDISIDKNNRIWLAYSGGICYYDQGTALFHIAYENRMPISNIHLVYDSSRNCMWSADYDGYFKIDCSTMAVNFYPYQKKLDTKFGIESIYIDSKGRLWILCDRRGYYTINLSNNFQYYYDQDIWPMQLFEDNENKIWMSTWESGFRKIVITGDTHEHILFPDPYIPKQSPYDEIYYGITESKSLSGNNLLWITKSTEGVVLFDKKEEKFVCSFKYDANIKNGIATDFNNVAYTDPDGIIWLCTWHGLTKINRQEQQFNSRELSFLQTRNYNRLSGIQADPYNHNIIWLGIEGSGIMKFNRLTNIPVQRYFYNSGGEIQSDINDDWRWIKNLYTDSKKNIWATTAGGLIKITNGAVTKHPVKFNNESVYPLNLVEYPDGNLWLSTAKGLVSFDIATGTYNVFQYTFEKNKPATNYLRDIIKQDNNNLLVVGREGAFQYNISCGIFKKLVWHFNQLDNGGQQDCYCIEKIKDHIYIGTSAGLIDYNLTNNQSVIIGSKEGINKVYNNRLKKDSKDNLWIFSSHGLYKYDVVNKTFENFTTGDGIYDFNEDQVGFFEFENQFHIGYRMAITSFNPLEVNVNSTKVNPVITDMYVNNTILNINIDSFINNTLHLSYRKNDLKFDFTAPDFTNSDKITFAHQLEGYDKDWIYSGSLQTAIYTNLKGGNYVFKVKACNSSGLWNENEKIVKINIATPFWQATWFYLLVVALLLLIGYMLYRYRVNQLIELFKVRDTISKNLHDEIGATLSSINIYSDVARKKNTAESEVNVLIERIYKASGQVMESMNDIVWYINPKNDSWDNIIVRMREYAIPLLEAKNIFPDFDIDEALLKLKLSMQQRQHIFFIFKEAINNIVKYAEAGNVTVQLHKKEKQLMLLVSDDGKGFDMGIKHSGNGVANMQQRAGMMKGSLTLLSEKNKGTSIKLQLPIT